MNTNPKIWLSFFALMLSGIVSFAQVEKSQSRLNIGSSPAKEVVKKSTLNGVQLVSTKVPDEIKVDKNTAVNQFYKDLLLSGKPSGVLPKSVASSERKASDMFYDAEGVSVSNVYPNPANDYANLNYRITENSKNAKISFINILGGSVGDFTLDPADTKLQVSTRNWDNGIYFYQLMVEGRKVATKKLIVRHQ